MKIIIAPDSFKGSLTARQAANAIAQGLKSAIPDADYDLIPIADGGEGTVEALVTATNGRVITVPAHDPNGNVIKASFGILGNSNTAVIETAAASGIQYLNSQSNPLTVNTFGTGELIKAALDQNVKRIIVGLGGSGTTDGGVGMIRALGAHFYGQDDQELLAGGDELSRLERIGLSELDPRLAKTEIILAADVTNPLTGKEGAVTVFGPQKGVTKEVIPHLDQALQNYAKVIHRDTGKNVANLAGAGAAGGLGAAFLAFTNAQIKSGIQTILNASNFEQRVKNADVVITGEGQLDYQTQFGKAPYGVAKLAKEVSPEVVVIAVAASLGERATDLYQTGMIDGVFASKTTVKPLSVAIQEAASDLEVTSQGIGHLIRAFR